MARSKYCRAVVRVSVFKRGNDFFVEPPIAYLAGGEEFRLFNVTSEPLRLFIGASLHSTIGNGPREQQIPGGRSLRRALPSGAPNRHHRYRVWMTKSKKWAKGNSDPVIIIDNP